MKILYFTDTYLPKVDGIVISVTNFTKILSKRGHKFVICAPRYGGNQELDVDRGMEKGIIVKRFLAQSLPSYEDVKIVVPSLTGINKIVKDFEPDIIHVQTPAFLGMAGTQFAWQKEIPLVSTYHTMVNEQHEYMNMYKLLKLDGLLDFVKDGMPLTIDIIEKLTFKSLRKKVQTDINKKLLLSVVNFLYDRADLVLSPSHLIKQELESYNLKTPVEVLSNGMDLEAFSGTPKTYPSELSSTSVSLETLKNYPWKIIHVGRLSYEKNCDVLLQAFKVLKQTLPNAEFTIVGDGPALKGIRQVAGELGLGNSVKLTGFYPHDDLPKLYPQFDLFWTASTMETQGLVVLEGMACGLATVGVDSYALPELIVDGKNGLLAKPHDFEALAQKAIEILLNKEKYESFSRESLAIAQTHEINNCADKLERIYERMLA